MSELSKLRKVYKLKEIYRMNSVQNRKESSAEHSWSCLMLADYFLGRVKAKLDRMKVYDLLIYHDLVEIEAGDVPLHHDKERESKKEDEKKAMLKLKKELPKAMEVKFEELFNEFEEMKTPEAKFAKAIDRLDAMIHEMDYKDDWKGWTEEMVRKYHDKEAGMFPEIKEFYEEALAFVRKNGYFDQ